MIVNYRDLLKDISQNKKHQPVNVALAFLSVSQTSFNSRYRGLKVHDCVCVCLWESISDSKLTLIYCITQPNEIKCFQVRTPGAQVLSRVPSPKRSRCTKPPNQSALQFSQLHHTHGRRTVPCLIRLCPFSRFFRHPAAQLHVKLTLSPNPHNPTSQIASALFDRVTAGEARKPWSSKENKKKKEKQTKEVEVRDLVLCVYKDSIQHNVYKPLHEQQEQLVRENVSLRSGRHQREWEKEMCKQKSRV